MLTSYKREEKAARRSRPQKASSRSGEVAEFTRPEGLLRFAAAVGRGGVKTPPYGAKDTWAVSAKPRAGHARPLQTAPNGVPTAERCPINRTQKRPKNRLVRHCGQNAHNSSKNMCNFLNKTPLRKGGVFGTIKLCKSVCLELCPEQDWGMCQMTQDLCGPDNRTAL